MERPVSHKVAVSTLGLLALLGGYAFARRARGYTQMPPELRSPLSRFRSPSFGPVLLRLAKARLARPSTLVSGVEVEARQIVGADGTALQVYIYRPRGLEAGSAAMLYTHGGGLIAGSAPAFHDRVSAYARDLGIVVVSPEYRLAPQHPFPAPLDDVHSSYQWLIGAAKTLGIDPGKIIVAGDSAGGGLTAALCQRLRDTGSTAPILQLLAYPMLDDRSALTPEDVRGEILWTRASNAFGWSSYLGHAPGRPSTARYAVPAREQNLVGLPPAWIGIGTLDLFLDEDRAYSQRLNAAGVTCDYVEVEGAFHAFDALFPDTAIATTFRGAMLAAVERAIASAGR